MIKNNSTYPKIGLALGSASARSRMSGDLPDTILSPQLSNLGLMEFSDRCCY